MSGALTRLRGSRSVTWRTMLGLVLVPLTIAGVFLWGLWNPEERLDTVTAAVVNLDEPIELDGQLVPLGRVLAAELIGGGVDEATEEAAQDAADAERTNFEWLLTDEADAAAGLDDGRYTTVITIPKNFSSAATSISEGPEAARTATIEVSTSDRGRLLDAALSGIVTQTATNVLNQQLGAQFVGGVFVGMNELGRGMATAADGASALATGGTQLADGASELADGTDQLAEGTSQLAAGSSELARGAGSLANGADQLADGAGATAAGAGSLAAGATELSTGLGDFAAGASDAATGITSFTAGVTEYTQGVSDLAVGARQSAVGSRQVADGVQEYVTQINGVLTPLQSALTEAVGPTTQLREDVANGLVPPPPGFTQAEFVALLDVALEQMSTADGMLGEAISGGSQLAAGAGEAAGGSEAIAGGLETMASEGVAMSDGGAALAAGAQQLSEGAAGLAAGGSSLATGATGLAGGVSQLSEGTAGIAAGASGLAGGTSELSSGVAALAAGVPDLADGAGQLADGAEKSAKGAGSLASGLDEAAAEIPNYSQSEIDRMADIAVAPVEARGSSDELFNASGVPLFAGIALWAGALAVFMVLAPLWQRTREAALGLGAIALRSAIPAVALGALQGVIAGIVLPLMLGYSLDQGVAFFGVALVAGVSFSLFVQGLSAMFAGFGRFIAFALLVVAFTVGIVSTVPGALSAIGDASPIGAAFTGFQSVAAGVPGVGGAVLLLVLWGLAGLVLTMLGVRRARRA